jgi:hypothetical protein
MNIRTAQTPIIKAFCADRMANFRSGNKSVRFSKGQKGSSTNVVIGGK